MLVATKRFPLTASRSELVQVKLHSCEIIEREPGRHMDIFSISFRLSGTPQGGETSDSASQTIATPFTVPVRAGERCRPFGDQLEPRSNR
jgi:hypothetical protein